MNTRITLAIAATALIAVPLTALTTVALTPAPTPEPARVVTVYVQDDAAITAYGDAVEALRDAGGRGEDLLPYLIELAEVDNSIRLTSTR